jgi:hypothetical protein
MEAFLLSGRTHAQNQPPQKNPRPTGPNGRSARGRGTYKVNRFWRLPARFGGGCGLAGLCFLSLRRIHFAVCFFDASAPKPNLNFTACEPDRL